MQGYLTSHHELQNIFCAWFELVVSISNQYKQSMNLSLIITERSLVTLCISNYIDLRIIFGIQCKLIYLLKFTLPCQFLCSSISKQTGDF